MELFTHTVACHAHKASAASMTEGHLISPVVKREFVTTSEWERQREQAKERPGLAVFFQPSTSVRRYFILSIPSHSCHHIPPHTTPSVCIFTKTAIVPLVIAHWPALSALHCWSSRRDKQTAQLEGVQGCERDGGGQWEWRTEIDQGNEQ